MQLPVLFWKYLKVPSSLVPGVMMCSSSSPTLMCCTCASLFSLSWSFQSVVSKPVCLCKVFQHTCSVPIGLLKFDWNLRFLSLRCHFLLSAFTATFWNAEFWKSNCMCEWWVRILTEFILNSGPFIKRSLEISFVSISKYVIWQLLCMVPNTHPSLSEKSLAALLNWGVMVSNSFIKPKLCELLSSDTFSYDSCQRDS